MLQVPQVQPLAGEIFDERARPFVGHHAAYLLLQHGGCPELPRSREVQQFVVGNAAPQKERQSAREFRIADLVAAAGSDSVWRRMAAENELGTRKNPRKRELNA